MPDDAPPPVSELSPAEPEARIERAARQPFGWILSGALIALLFVGQLSAYFTRDERPQHRSFLTEEMSLHQYVYAKKWSRFFGQAGATLSDTKELRAELADVLPHAATDVRAARLAVEMSVELGAQPPPRAIVALVKEGDPKSLSLAEAYGRAPPSIEGARRLERAISSSSFLDRLARDHLRQRAGLPIRSEAVSDARLAYAATVLFGAAVAMVVGIALWVVFFAMRTGGALHPKGPPVGPLSPAVADRFALRFGLVMLAFLLLELGTELAGLPVRQPAATLAIRLIGSIGLIGLVWFAYRRNGLVEIGLRRAGFGRHVLWGLGAAVANAPVVLGLELAATKIFAGLPSPEHPASVELLTNPSLATVLVVIFSACVAAPILEETLFRGTLLPALAGVWRRPWVAGLVSSLLFAVIHPTGIPAWPGLAAIGGMSAYLTYQTGSLVPSMAMHSLHNLGTLLVGLAFN
ncbi:MAG: CPBP family intramembrane metalloprotease [Fimbriimonas ginsengisoli]|uniref:CPBP family intramembrane metalloprotease n=1 Tax=Fimbriimonas ginsengisoli TaxID=1005039 RepID=A0A931PST1_FIMGI|nr:CPBP family intramembrane metalloprotease [Fimbriimonas ginsengisoli]